MVNNQIVVGEEEAIWADTPPVLVWALEDTVAFHPGGEMKRRSWFGWKREVTEATTECRSGLELETSLCFLGSCRLVSEEPT